MVVAEQPLQPCALKMAQLITVYGPSAGIHFTPTMEPVAIHFTLQASWVVFFTPTGIEPQEEHLKWIQRSVTLYQKACRGVKKIHFDWSCVRKMAAL